MLSPSQPNWYKLNDGKYYQILFDEGKLYFGGKEVLFKKQKPMRKTNLLTLLGCAITLIIVFFVAKASFNYFDKKVVEYRNEVNTNDLQSECEEVYGEVNWNHYVTRDDYGKDHRYNVFTCEFD